MASNFAVTKGSLKNKYFLMVCLVGFAYNFAINTVNSSFSLFVDYIGGSPGITGTVSILFTATAVVGRMVSSRTSDHIGRRFTMALGCFLYAACVWLSSSLESVFLICALRALQGFGFAASNTGASAANVDTAPPDKLGLASSLFYLSSSVGFIICGFIIEPFADAGQLPALYKAIAVLLAGGGLVSMACTYEKVPGYERGAGDTEDTDSAEEYKGLYKYFEKRSLPAAITAFSQCIGYSAIITFIMLFASQNNIPNYGLFFTVGASIALVCNLFGSGLVEKRGVLSATVPCFTLSGVSLIAMGATGSPLLYFVSAAAFGVGFGLCFPALHREAMRGIPTSRRGAASSTILISNDLGIGLGAVLWGFVGSVAGLSVTFILAGAAYLVSAVLSVIFFKKGRK